MKKRLILGLALCAILVLSACGAAGGSAPSGGSAQSAGSAPSAGTVTKIAAKDAYERIGSGEELVLLDVRTAEEYAQAHIPGAILLPNEDIGTARPAQLPVLDTEILVYCRSGNRSAQAAEKLAKMGYTNVYDLGGIKDWPYETESGAFSSAAKDGTLSSFTAYDLSGVARDETIFSGHKLTMINIWATFCGPCLREMPELGTLAKEYADKGVQVVGIVADVPQQDDGSFDLAQVQNARELAAQAGADYPHLLPSADLVSAKLHAVNAVPETIFVDENGSLVGESYVGARSSQQWAAIIDGLLSGGKA